MIINSRSYVISIRNKAIRITTARQCSIQFNSQTFKQTFVRFHHKPAHAEELPSEPRDVLDRRHHRYPSHFEQLRHSETQNHLILDSRAKMPTKTHPALTKKNT